jgi:AraC-like DNA-binding protein
MSPALVAPSQTRLALCQPPYTEFTPILADWRPPFIPLRGCGVIWWLVDAVEQQREHDWLRRRPAGLPLVVVLPLPHELPATLPLLSRLPALEPRAVLPTGGLVTPDHIRALLSDPPTQFAATFVGYLADRGLLRTDRIRREVRQIFELAPEVHSVSQLARRLYTSRRTIGRHFAAEGLPVPSHWLQIGRLLHVAIRLQNDTASLFRIAARFGYPEAFTLSNQMRRLIGWRPSEVRRCLGWEWIIESWLSTETHRGAVDLDRHLAVVGRYITCPCAPKETTANSKGDGPRIRSDTNREHVESDCNSNSGRP